MLRYSFEWTRSLGVFHDAFLLFVLGVSLALMPADTSGMVVAEAVGLGSSGGSESRWLGGNAPEDHGCSVLDCFETLA